MIPQTWHLRWGRQNHATSSSAKTLFVRTRYTNAAKLCGHCSPLSPFVTIAKRLSHRERDAKSLRRRFAGPASGFCWTSSGLFLPRHFERVRRLKTLTNSTYQHQCGNLSRPFRSVIPRCAIAHLRATPTGPRKARPDDRLRVEPGIPRLSCAVDARRIISGFPGAQVARLRSDLRSVRNDNRGICKLFCAVNARRIISGFPGAQVARLRSALSAPSGIVCC